MRNSVLRDRNRKPSERILGKVKYKRLNTNMVQMGTENLIEKNIILLASEIRNNLALMKNGKQPGLTQSRFSNTLTKKPETFKMDLSAINYKILEYILKKKIRNNDELVIIRHFISSYQKFLKNIPYDSEEKLISPISYCMKLETKPKNSILFKYGSRGTKFYLIIKGQLSILIPEETKVYITMLRYVEHLMMLKLNGEEELLKRTMMNNSKGKYGKIYDIILDEIISEIKKFLKKLTKNNKRISFNNNNISHNSKDDENIKNDKIDISSSREINNTGFIYKTTKNVNEDSKMEQLNITTRLIVDYKLNILDFEPHQIKDLIYYYIYLKSHPQETGEDYAKKTYINNNTRNTEKEEFENKEEVVIFRYYEVVKKGIGETLGELALNNNDKKRTATVICNTDCMLGFLSIEDYNSFLREIEVKKRKANINILMSFSLFNRILYSNFESRYFNFFKLESMPMGKILIAQGNKIKKVHFVIGGEVEISTKCRVGELFQVIKWKVSKLKEDNIETIHKKNTLKILKKKLESFENNNNIINIRVHIVNNKDILGLEDYYYNENNISFLTAKCISKEVILYSIEKKIFQEITSKINEVKERVELIEAERDNFLICRLLNLLSQIIRKEDRALKEQDSFRLIADFFFKSRLTSFFPHTQKKPFPLNTKFSRDNINICIRKAKIFLNEKKKKKEN